MSCTQCQDSVVYVATVNRGMQYSDFVSTLFKIDTDQVEFCHMAMGISGEAGELTDALKKHAIYGKKLDRTNVIEELGDLRFYMQALMNKLDISDVDILQHNANKLAKRYPKGEYSNQDAIARADKVEEDICVDTDVLESMLPNIDKPYKRDAEDDSDGSKNYMKLGDGSSM